MKALRLNRECSIVKALVDSKNLPSDLQYPVTLTATPGTLEVTDRNLRLWVLEL